MIYVTQGHEFGIGLEVFFKSFLTLTYIHSSKFTLIVNIKTLEKTLTNLNLKFQLYSNLLTIHKHRLKIIFFENKIIPQSTSALEIALEQLKKNKGFLITLPTSKDQLIYNHETCLGYTEYLRSAFQNSHLAMFFYSENLKMLLLSDHVQLSDVANSISKDLVVNKISYALKFSNYDSVYLSGINPHAGENGLLGSDDKILNVAMKELMLIYPKTSFEGPISGDILHYKIDPKENQLLVYCHHDQGLVLFKSRQSLLGINITLGLPFLRMSVDHGTAFDLYGKNKANYLGCFYLLKKALEFYDQ